MGKTYTIHIEETGKSRPRPHEIEAAQKIASQLKSSLIFLRRESSKSPDLYILKTNTRWELKSPTGGSKHTIQNNLRNADDQSENVILDLSVSKFSDEKGISRAEEFMKHERSKIKKLKVLLKSGELVDIK